MNREELMLMTKQYKEGKVSIGTMAQNSGLSVSEVIDVFTELGMKSPITFEDYLQGFNTLKNFERK